MSEHELEKLLGGFAADTLTPEEKQTLYSAALQDQRLFNALADEQALKELLADPNVRRRLLASLKQKSPSGTGGSLPWLDWFRRPASLAFAGGLAAAVFAVVLGTKIYQDSLRQAAQSVATEDSPTETPPAPTSPASQPASPQATEPQLKAKDKADAIMAPAKNEASVDKRAKRERAAPPKPQEQRDVDIARDSATQRREQDEMRRQADAPVAALGKVTEEAIAPADQKLSANSAPLTAAPESKPMQAPAVGALSSSAAPAVGARALYYGEVPARLDGRMPAKEKEEALKSIAESESQANRLERKPDGLPQSSIAVGKSSSFKPLGLRYSLAVRGTNKQDRDADAKAASESTVPGYLTVETNQEAYLQVWKTVGSSTPQLLLPRKETGQISLKISAGQRQQISLPKESGSVALTARLSRVPFGPITRQEAAMFDRVFPNQLQESITASGIGGSQEQTTYIVNQDLSPTAQLSVTIPLALQ